MRIALNAAIDTRRRERDQPLGDGDIPDVQLARPERDE